MQPTPHEFIPEHHRAQLVGEFVDAPNALSLDTLARPFERDIIEAACCVNFIPMPPDVTVLKRNMIGLGILLARVSATTRIKSLSRQRESTRQLASAAGRTSFPESAAEFVATLNLTLRFARLERQ